MAGPYLPGPVGGRPFAAIYETTGRPVTWASYLESAYTEREAVLGSGDGTGGLLLVNWKLRKGLYDTETVVDAHTRITRGDEVICDLPGMPGWSSCWLYGAGQYRVRIDTSQRVLPTSTRTTTDWELAHDPDAGPVPPLVLATYQLPVDLNNAPGRRHRVSVDVGYQPGGPPGPQTWAVQAWATFDDGETWRPVYDKAIRSGGRGNTIDQTVIRAYRLTSS